MPSRLDSLLGYFTIYRTIINILAVIIGCAITLAYVGMVPRDGTWLLITLAVAISMCYGANKLLARVMRLPANAESPVITSLLLFAIVSPAHDAAGLVSITTASLLAVSSKYFITYRGVHIFNPAAFGALAVSLLGIGHASWWITSSLLAPVIVVAGLLMLRRLHEYRLFLIYLAVSLATVATTTLLKGLPLEPAMQAAVVSSPLILLGAFMLTEPLTLPGSHHYRLWYAALAGALGASQLDIGPLSFSPLVGLLLANLVFFGLARRQTARLQMEGKTMVSLGIYEYSFSSDQPVRFQPGQYAELMVPHRRPDLRGTRRYFSIVSSPESDQLRFAVRLLPERGSSYKRALHTLPIDSTVTLVGVGGDFTLPTNPAQKLLFVAGGIGITPFVSMLSYLLTRNQPRNIVLLYAAASPDDFAYRQVVEQAAEVGVSVIYIASQADASWAGETGHIDAAMIKCHVGDITERRIYISGPPGLVNAATSAARSAGARRGSIVTDRFSGY